MQLSSRSQRIAVAQAVCAYTAARVDMTARVNARLVTRALDVKVNNN